MSESRPRPERQLSVFVKMCVRALAKGLPGNARMWNTVYIYIYIWYPPPMDPGLVSLSCFCVQCVVPFCLLDFVIYIYIYIHMSIFMEGSPCSSSRLLLAACNSMPEPRFGGGRHVA